MWIGVAAVKSPRCTHTLARTHTPAPPPPKLFGALLILVNGERTVGPRGSTVVSLALLNLMEGGSSTVRTAKELSLRQEPRDGQSCSAMTSSPSNGLYTCHIVPGIALDRGAQLTGSPEVNSKGAGRREY